MLKPLPASCVWCSLKAGGVALNLTHANHIFLMDPWWYVGIETRPPPGPVYQARVLTHSPALLCRASHLRNPAAEMQAIDRTHRIGQYKPIFATRLIVEDTIEVSLQHGARGHVSEPVLTC